jgi:hypothetical protein
VIAFVARRCDASDLLIRLDVPAGLKAGAEASVRPLFFVLDLDLGEIGETFTAAEVAKWRDALIRITGYADGILIGGMSYPIAVERKG